MSPIGMGFKPLNLVYPSWKKTMINLYLNEIGIFQSEFGFTTTHHETITFAQT